MKKSPANAVTKKISEGTLSMRSPASVLIEKIGLSGIIFGIVSGVCILLGFILVWLRMNGDLISSYGSYGRMSYVESFPYMPFVIIAIGLISLLFVLRRFDLSYKRPLGVILFLTLITALGLAWYGSTLPIGNQFFRGGGMMMRMYGSSGANFVYGTVESISKETIVVVDADGKSYTLRITDQTHFPFGEPTVGDTVRSVGTWDGSIFVATGVRVFDQSQGGMMGRGMGQGRRMQGGYQ
jgi:hypothetical protein